MLNSMIPNLIRRSVPGAPIKSTHEGVELEYKIASILEKLGLSYNVEPFTLQGVRPDFIVKVGNRKIAIEAKAWRSAPPLHFIARIRDLGEVLIDSKAAEEVLIITKTKLPFPKDIVSTDGIRILTVKELTPFLRSKMNN